jgi:broad specificity phosphatase PhoE
MKLASFRTILPGAALTLALSIATPALAQKAIIVVRHAEKVDESNDPLLSAAGMARAEALAKALKSLDVKGVYVTQYQRTTLTAAPLLAATGLKAIQIPATDTPELVTRMNKEHPNDVVLTVGHSNTLPLIVKLLGAADPVEIGSSEYDSLFVIVPRPSGPPTVLRLRY